MMDRQLDQQITLQQALRQPYAAYEAMMDRLLEAIFVHLDVRPARLSILEQRLTRTAKAALKRAFDVAVALTALVMLAPLLVVLAVLVRTRLGSPIIFRQERPGRYGQPFTLYKFRTMTDARGVDGALLPDEDRLTPFGQLLRSTSLDELPELINVLRGDMSLVGPRPLLMEYLPLYSPEQARRHNLRPGITGWAQINGRNAVSWDTRFALDVWYIDHQSLWLDIKIIVKTGLKVVQREGISQEGYATMPHFTGSRPAVQSTAHQA